MWGMILFCVTKKLTQKTYLQWSASQKQSALGVEIDKGLPPLAFKVFDIVCLLMEEEGIHLDFILEISETFVNMKTRTSSNIR